MTSLQEIYARLRVAPSAGATGCGCSSNLRLPLVANPRERSDYPLGRWNLYIGGAGRAVSDTPTSILSPRTEWMCSPTPNRCRFRQTCFNASCREVTPIWSSLCHPFPEYSRDLTALHTGRPEASGRRQSWNRSAKAGGPGLRPPCCSLFWRR